MKHPCGYCGVSTRGWSVDRLEEHMQEHKARGDGMDALFAGLAAFVSHDDNDTLEDAVTAATETVRRKKSLRVVSTNS